MTAIHERALNHEDFVAVPVSTLTLGSVCHVAFYTRDDAEGPARLFRAADFPITQEDLDHVANMGLTKLYIAATEHHEYQSYLRESLDDRLADESLSVTRRFGILNEVVRDVLNDAFHHNNLDNTVAETERLGQRAVDLICRNDAMSSELLGVLYHDYHTFTHSANVSYYCTMLAKALGILDRKILERITTGGLLHDLGKLEIPDAILTKEGKLTDQEFAIIKRHPTIGFRKLCRRKEMDFGQLMMVYQHHERMDGKGYPVGVGRGEIHEWGRICAVADVYEALTSNRPYRAAMRPKAAFEIMDRQCTTGFDTEMYQCWKTIILRS